MAEEEKKPDDPAVDEQAQAAPEAPPADDKPPEPPVIWKKVVEEGHAGAHGGAWKIALADMMTAMMAFFLLMWLLGATPEDQRKSIAEYFQPTDRKEAAMGETAGSNGMFGGKSIIDPEEGIPDDPKQQSVMERVTPRSEAGPGEDQGTSPQDKPHPKYAKNLTEEEKQQIAAQAEKEKLDKLEKEIQENLAQNPQLSDLKNQVSFTREKDGLRIDIIDKANFSMFGSGNAAMEPRARALINEVAKSLQGMPNKMAIKGHTDSVPFADNTQRSNWSLSIERAEATRRMLEQSGTLKSRFARIEGVADTAPYVPTNPADPRNRRISITVLYTDPPKGG